MHHKKAHTGYTKSVLNAIRNDRTLKTLLLAAALILFMGSLRPDTQLGMYQKKYWATKIGWQHYADVVITGDSRVLGGISPGQMQQTLGHRRIVNYGFASNLYLPQYLEAVEQVLKPRSDYRTIILGITPHSLTEDPDVTGQFFELKRLSKQDLFIDNHFAGLIGFFDYMSFHDAKVGLFPSLGKSQTTKEFFADGWLAYSKKPPGKKKELKKYRRMYERHRVTPAMIENLMDHVTQWSESGIRVYGFLVPTCKQMVEMENRLSGFNENEFVASFKSAGGIWIEIDPTGYDSFDGSHLQRESALEFSRDLAMKISGIEQQSPRISRAD